MSWFKSFPLERQLEKMDCGAACLKMVARYYGKYYSVQYLRELCGTNRDGISVYDMSHGAEAIGFRTHSFTADMNSLRQKVNLPVIVHWKSNHFVVVYKISAGHIYVADPSKGKLKYTDAAFQKGWMKGEKPGILLALEPGPDFQLLAANEKADKRKTWENIFAYFTPYKSSFVNLFGIMLLVTVLQGLLPFISKAVIDVGIQTQDLDFINIVLVGNITIIIAVTLSNVVRDWVLLHLTSRINIALISDYLSKLLRLPITFFENRMVGDILQRANDHERIRSFLMNNSLNTIFSSLTLVVFAVVLLIYNTTVFWIFVTGNSIYFAWVTIFMRIRKKLDWEYFELTAKNQSYWVETVTGIQDIKLNNYDKKKRWAWESIQAGIFKVNLRVLSVNSAQNIGAQSISNITNFRSVIVCPVTWNSKALKLT